MSERKRLHRDDPPRVGPVRNFTNLYRQSGVANRDADGESPASVQHPQPKVPGSDQISDGVGLAYQVIERYITAGRKGAEQLSKQSFRPARANRPLQELVDRMLRSQAEMLPLWLDLFGSLARVDFVRSEHPAGPDPRPTNNGAARGRSLMIALTSSRPVEIWVDLQEGAQQRALVTPGLQELDRRKPALTDIRFVPENEHRRGKLCVTIPETQPAGLYSGVVVDPKSGETRGTLSIRVARNHSTARTRTK